MDNYFNVKQSDPPYQSDILRGKLKIYDVPEECRVWTAYIYACRYARDCIKNEVLAYLEKRLIEQQLLCDIMNARRNKDERRQLELEHIFEGYFMPDTMNVYNSVGIVGCLDEED